MKTKAFIFDFDGVIADSEEYYNSVTADVFLKRGVKYDRDKANILAAGKPQTIGMQLMADFYGVGHLTKELIDERMSKMEQIYTHEMPFVPGFINLFETLKKEFNLPIAIATGGEKKFYDAIDKRLKISKMFNNHVYRSSDVKNHKPAPDIFIYAAKKLGYNSIDCVVFEDAPNRIAAALRAKSKVVAITSSFPKKILIQELNKIMTEGYEKEDLLLIPDYSKKSINKLIKFIKK